MSTRISFYSTRLALALPAFAMCALIATGASAESKSYRPSDDRSDKSAAEHKVSTRDSKSYKPDSSPSKPSDSRSNDSHGTATYRPDSGSGSYRPGSWGNRSGQNDSGKGTYKPGGSPSNHNYGRPESTTSHTYKSSERARSSYRPGSPYSRRDDQGYRPDTNGYKPDTGYRPDSDHSRSYKPGTVRIYTRPDYGHYEPPKSYQPPSYRGGYYYYPRHSDSKPRHYGYWVFDNYDSRFSRRSIYYHYGFFPYVQLSRVYLTPYISVNYVNAPIAVENGYYLSKARYDGLNEVLADIRNAWIGGRFDLIESHIVTGEKMAVLLDGSYDYSIDADDYLNMTRDVLGEIQTQSFTWENVRQRSDGDFTAFGKHRYADSSGINRTIYVSYTLQKSGRDYVITEVGSSNSPLN